MGRVEDKTAWGRFNSGIGIYDANLAKNVAELAFEILGTGVFLTKLAAEVLPA